MSEQYGWKFLLDGVDITDKVGSFTIQSSLESYCRELTFDLLDDTLYDTLDFSVIPEVARVEVFTRTESVSDEYDEYDEYGDVWVSQGLFFIERPTFQVGVNQTLTGIWGRQSTAVLGEPFAQKVTKIWSSDTTLYAICQELLESVGLTWDSSKCELQNFSIYADNFEADDMYPIEVLKSLIGFIVGEEGFITSDKYGDICIKRLSREPASSDYDLTDLVVQSINEEPVWPEFGNRIKIIPSETVSQDTIELTCDRECMGTGAATSVDIFAQVKNGEGVPINDALVQWYFDPPYPTNVWLQYPVSGGYQKTALQNTSRILISKELQVATGFTSLSVKFEIDELVGVWAYADKTRSLNFAPEGGYVIDGKNIFLTEESLVYCDQTVFVSYYASGMVKNTIVYEEEDEYEPIESEDPLGSITVIASVAGREDSKVIYVDNSCRCKTTLSVEVLYPEDVATEPIADAVFTPKIRPATGYTLSMNWNVSLPLWACDPYRQDLIPNGTVFEWSILSDYPSGVLYPAAAPTGDARVIIYRSIAKPEGIGQGSCGVQLKMNGVIVDTVAVNVNALF